MSNDFEGWIDESGMIHAHEGTYSENGPLFTAEYFMLEELNSALTPYGKNEVKDIINNIIEEEDTYNWYNPNPQDDNQPWVHLSHDNMTGLYCLHILAGRSVDKLPIIKWNDRIWLHPRDIAFYTLLKENIWSKVLLLPFLAVLWASTLVSISSQRSRTSGKMMWWLRLNILQMHTSKIVSTSSKFIWFLCENILKKNHGKNPIIDISSIYFKDEKHPINILMKEVYENN